MSNSNYTARGTTNGFCPVAYLNNGSPLVQLSTTVNITGYSAPDGSAITVGSAAMIDDEIVRIDAVAGTNLTIGRGCCDTVPAEHANGTPIWFFDQSIGSDNREYAGTELLGVKVLPRTLRGGPLAIENSPPNELQMNFRFAAPYPPAQVKVNGGNWFTKVEFGDSLANAVITWVHRNRVIQQDQLVSHSEANITPEAGTTYRIKVYKSDGTLVRTITGITGNTYTYRRASAAEDLGYPATSKNGYLLLVAMRDGYASFQPYRIDFSAGGLTRSVIVTEAGSPLTTEAGSTLTIG